MQVRKKLPQSVDVAEMMECPENYAGYGNTKRVDLT